MLNRAETRTGILMAAACSIILTASCSTDPVGNVPVSADGFIPPSGPLQESSGTLVNPGNGYLSLEGDSEQPLWLVWPAGSTRVVDVADAIRLPGRDRSPTRPESQKLTRTASTEVLVAQDARKP